MGVWVVIPVKSLEVTKSRLAAVLTPLQRAELTQRLLRRLLLVIGETTAVAQVLVVTQDERVQQLALAGSALVVAEPKTAVLNEAIAYGVATACEQGATGVLVLPSDLPLITAQDVAQIIAFWSGKNGVICSDEAATGTNALLLPTAVAFDFAYGLNSFQSHLQEAQKRGLSVQIIENTSIQFDIDTVQDWLAYQSMLQVLSVEC